ncbi:MAG: DUF732 domain-containing protein [Mycobacterium sp.]
MRSSRRDTFPLTVVSAVLVAAVLAMLLSGCGSGEDLMTSVASPHGADTAEAMSGSDGVLPSPPSRLSMTPEQVEYLDELKSSGVRRSSDLMALSIGQYVCQARAAGQSPQGVWDFVFPLVRGEIHDMNPNTAVTAMAKQVDETTGLYIQIATDRLC